MADDHSGEQKKPLSDAQKQLIRRMELERLRKHSQKLRGRNNATGLVIGAFVMGVCILCCRLPFKFMTGGLFLCSAHATLNEHSIVRGNIGSANIG